MSFHGSVARFFLVHYLLHHSLSIQILKGRCLGCFQVLATMNKAANPHSCTGFCMNRSSFHLHKYREVGFLNYMVNVCLIL